MECVEESVPKNIDFAVVPLPETLKEVFEELEVLDGSADSRIGLAARSVSQRLMKVRGRERS